jgi:streptogramin lyase
MHKRHLQFSHSHRWRGSILILVLCVLLGGAGLARAAGGQDRQHATAAPALLETTLPGYEPWGLARDHTGHIWVAEPECDPTLYSQPVCPSLRQGSLLVYSAASFYTGAPAAHVYREPATYSSPFFVAVDAAENIWFTEPVSNALGELDQQGNWHQWSVPVPAASPFDLTIDQYGHIWFTEPGISAIGEFMPASGHFLSFPTPTVRGDPYGIAGPDPSTGSLWFTENNSQVHRIGRLFPDAGGGSSRAIQEYLVPATNNDTPHLLTVDRRGSVWWSEGWAGQIGQLIIGQARQNSSAGIHEYPVPAPACSAASNCAVHISGITATPDGRIWFDDSLSSRVGFYTPGASFTLYTLEGSLSSGSHPHDGLTVDASGNLWLSEEFGNRLVKIIEPRSPPPTPGATRLPPSHATPSSASASGCPGDNER